MNWDVILFQIFPYVALAIAVVETTRRLVLRKFSQSSLSSQFLERDQLFLGSVPWHYGILVIFLGHLVAFMFPKQLLLFNSVPLRLYILETTALAGGLIALIGLVNLIVRRFRSARIRVVTSPMDVIILVALLVQVLTGLYLASHLRWGSSWFAVALTPYLRSLFVFQPDISLVSQLPLMVKVHIVGAFTIFALLPFSRLIHLLLVPLQYIRRPHQVVIWNRDPKQRISRS